MSAAIHWSGPALVGGAAALAMAIGLISPRPVVGQSISPNVAALLLLSTALLLLSLPAVYAVQAEKVGAVGLVAHALLAIGLLLPAIVGATPLLHPTLDLPSGENPLVVLGIALTLGLLLTGISTFQADVLPRPAAVLLLAATAGFFFVFFVAEFLPAPAGQIGSAVFGILLALGFAWIGVALWLRT